MFFQLSSLKNSVYIQAAEYIWIKQNTHYPRDKRVRVPLVSRDFLNEDTNCTEYSALTKPALQCVYPTTGENKHRVGWGVGGIGKEMCYLQMSSLSLRKD